MEPDASHRGLTRHIPRCTARVAAMLCACAIVFFTPSGMTAESTNAAAAPIKSILSPGLTNSGVLRLAATNRFAREPALSFWQTLRAEETYREKVRRDVEE